MSIPESFYRAEVRDGYLVSEQSKSVWAVQLDLLVEFQKVCLKHNLRYFACGGTLLGVVRHKGFIPWDDDIDIMMPREDYDKLSAIAPEEFQEPYFFQTEETDPGYLLRHAKIRNSATSAIQKSLSRYQCTFNQGVFIDIFPLDKVPESQNETDRYYDALWEVWGKAWRYHAYTYRRHRTTLMENLKCWFGELFGRGCHYNMKYEELARMYAGHDYSRWGILATNLTSQRTDRFLWNVADFNETVMMPFEMIELPVPVNYDNILKKSYGQWREFVVGGSLHGEIAYDVEKCYKEYLNIK